MLDVLCLEKTTYVKFWLWMRVFCLSAIDPIFKLLHNFYKSYEQMKKYISVIYVTVKHNPHY